MDGKTILYILIALIILEPVLLLFLKRARKTKTSKKQEKTVYTYQMKPYLLTKSENSFYKALLPIAANKQLTVCPKVRLADIIEPSKGQNWQGAFYKIQAKHIDFLLCKSPLSPVLAIELDDYSHERQDRKERDAFVDQALKSANLPILHVMGTADLESKINNAL